LCALPSTKARPPGPGPAKIRYPLTPWSILSSPPRHQSPTGCAGRRSDHDNLPPRYRGARPSVFRRLCASVRGRCSRNPVADRPAAVTTRASMRGAGGEMRQGTTAEARLDQGKLRVPEPRVRQSSAVACQGIPPGRHLLWRPKRGTMPWSVPESGECRNDTAMQEGKAKMASEYCGCRLSQ
jgi:hypothetical protein